MRNAAFLLLFSTWLWTCGSEKEPIKPQPQPAVTDPCGPTQQSQIVYDAMVDYYLWWDKIPVDLEPSQYDGPEQLLPDLLYSSLDRWSYLVSKAADDAYYSGSGYIGIGISRQYDAAQNLRITQVFRGSPAELGGLKRGDIILAINGRSVLEIEAQNLWDTIWGEPAVGISVVLLIRDRSDAAREVTVQKAIVSMDPVQKTAIFDVAAKKVGYLLVDSFIDTTPTQVRIAFETFKSAGISELVLDLRYNGGGYVSGAQYLSSLIGGTTTQDQTFTSLLFNSKHPDMNGILKFSNNAVDLANALNLARVFVLTTQDSASASELVINGLKPFVSVVQIGDKTHGKPVGMLTIEFCDKVLVPIMFQSVNAIGTGGYFAGLTPDCSLGDDLMHDLGDAGESLLAGALYFVEYGTCPPHSVPANAQTAYPKKRLNLSGFERLVGAI